MNDRQPERSADSGGDKQAGTATAGNSGANVQASKPKTLTEKLCEVGTELTWVQKRGKNTFHGYNYATEADLVLAIRMLLYQRKVFLYPHVLSVKRESWTDDKGKRKSITDMEIKWEWKDGETGESQFSMMPGCGEDGGDKGTYKAITGSEKYLILKTFLIPTYDDAEQMAPTDKKALQKRVGTEKAAEMKAAKAAREAPSEEEAKKELLKGQVLFIRLPERFQGEYAAVYGKPIADAGMENFLNDCNAARFKGPEGIFYKLEAQYVSDCKAMGERRGFTVDYSADS